MTYCFCIYIFNFYFIVCSLFGDVDVYDICQVTKENTLEEINHDWLEQLQHLCTSHPELKLAIEVGMQALFRLWRIVLLNRIKFP
jgi:hypothetical protein